MECYLYLRIRAMGTIQVCLECNGVVNQIFAGDEGWGVCEDCGAVEQDTLEMTEEEYETYLSTL